MNPNAYSQISSWLVPLIKLPINTEQALQKMALFFWSMVHLDLPMLEKVREDVDDNEESKMGSDIKNKRHQKQQGK